MFVLRKSCSFRLGANVGVRDHKSDPAGIHFSCDAVARGAKFHVMYLQYATSNEIIIRR